MWLIRVSVDFVFRLNEVYGSKNRLLIHLGVSSEAKKNPWNSNSSFSQSVLKSFSQSDQGSSDLNESNR